MSEEESSNSDDEKAVDIVWSCGIEVIIRLKKMTMMRIRMCMPR